MPKTKSVPATKRRVLRNGKELPTGQEIYDRLMSKIEPELVLSNLKKLDVPYEKEAPAKRKARYARYAKAFKEYKTKYTAWLARVNTVIKAYKRAVVKASERASKTKEDSVLAALEAQMKTA